MQSLSRHGKRGERKIVIPKLTFIILLGAVIVTGLALYRVGTERNTLKTERTVSDKEIEVLRKKLGACHRNVSTACDPRLGGPFYMDCGEAVVPRYTTCVCTTMCLEDYSLVYTNRERCKNWSQAPQQIRPEPGDDEE